MTQTSLRELVSDVVDEHWEHFASRHPNLAATIDRTQLIESTVIRIEADESYRNILRDADIDEATLAAAMKAMRLIESWVRLLTPA